MLLPHGSLFFSEDAARLNGHQKLQEEASSSREAVLMDMASDTKDVKVKSKI